MLKTALSLTLASILISTFFAPISLAQNKESASSLAPVWSPVITTNDATERHENGFIAYGDKLYLLGGRGVKPVQIYDPETETWSNGPSSGFQMHHFQAVVYNDLIYVIGAYTGVCCDSEFGISHVYTYNPQTSEWNQLHEIPQNRRRGSTGAVVYNDKIYIVGGIEGGHGTSATAYNWFDEYDPATGQWKILPSAPRVRDHFHAVVYNSKLYLTGGRDTSHPSVTSEVIPEVDVFNFNTNSWSTLSSSKNLPTPRGGASSTLYQGKILVIGGETAGQTLAHKQTEAFDPISESWSTLADLNVGRHGTQASIYNDALYIAAGSAQKGGEPELNSIERYEDSAVEFITSNQLLYPGWNLIGLPIIPVENNYEAIYSDIAIDESIVPLGWNVNNFSYESTSNLSTGAAYWVKIDEGASSPQTQTITGTSMQSIQAQLVQGWNMVSGPSCDNVVLLGSSTSPAGNIPEGAVYYYDDGYQPAFSSVFGRGRLNQGLGYWIYSKDPSTLSLSCGSGKAAPSLAQTEASILSVEDDFGAIRTQDANGNTRTLYFGQSLDAASDIDAFQLPPRSFEGTFDTRFPDDKRLTDDQEGYILIQGSSYPMHISFDRNPKGKQGVLEITTYDAAGPNGTLEIATGGTIHIKDASTRYLHFKHTLQDASEVPGTFLVHGNYPNPFNPTTRITFDLPAPADVEVRVFDMLGREVAIRHFANQQPGMNRSIELNAETWPAGTYVYRLSTEIDGQSFVQSGRMVLLK